MINQIKRDFEDNFPSFLYVDHNAVGKDYLAVSFLFINNGRVNGAVRIFKRTPQGIDWKNSVKTLTSWPEVYKFIQKQR